MRNVQTLNFQPVVLHQSDKFPLLTLTLLFHPDISLIGAYFQLAQQEKQLPVSRSQPLFNTSCNNGQRALADPYLSRTPIMVSKISKGWQVCQQGSNTPITDSSGNLLDSFQLADEQLEKGVTLTLSGRIVILLHYAAAKSDDNNHYAQELLGCSANITQVRHLISQVADLKLPILIRGDSGTGKEVVANAIHQAGARKDKAFVSVNMAAIPRELAGSELFGSVKGGFTGASSRKGCFQQADNGTLFLDEIGEAPIEVQVALLRALETGVVQPIGSEKSQRLNVRIVAATDADLEQLIGAESFKLPLLQRLSGMVIELLPLRQRPEDFGLLFCHFLKIALSQTGQSNRLLVASPNEYSYWAWLFARCSLLSWPGNVRQLKNVATRLAVSLMGKNHFSELDWQGFVAAIDNDAKVSKNTHSTEIKQDKTSRRKPREILDDEIAQTLAACNWQIKRTADELGISRAALYQRIDANPALQRASNLSEQQLNQSYQHCDGNLARMVEDLQVSSQALKRRLNEIGVDCT